MKTKLLIATIGLVTIAVLSCNKQDKTLPQAVNNAAQNANGTSSTMSYQQQVWGLHQWYYYLLHDCVHVAIDCFDPIVITPSHFSPLQLAISGGPAAIATFFSDKANYSDILPASPASDSLASELATGRYDMSIQSFPSTIKKNIFIGTKSPVDTSNYTSVMQVDVK